MRRRGCGGGWQWEGRAATTVFRAKGGFEDGHVASCLAFCVEILLGKAGGRRVGSQPRKRKHRKTCLGWGGEGEGEGEGQNRLQGKRWRDSALVGCLVTVSREQGGTAQRTMMAACIFNIVALVVGKGGAAGVDGGSQAMERASVALSSLRKGGGERERRMLAAVQSTRSS